MATIPNLAQQPPQPQEQPQQFAPSMNAEIQDGGVEFKIRTSPFEMRVMPVPDNLIAQMIPIWLEQHPDEAILIMKGVKEKIKRNADLIHTIHATKN